MLTTLTVRVIGSIVCALVSWRVSIVIIHSSNVLEPKWAWQLVFAAIGCILGALVTPYLTTKPATIIVSKITRSPGSTLVSAILGLLIGLVVASLFSIPFYTLTGWPKLVVPMALIITLGISGIWIGALRSRDVRSILPSLETANARNAVRSNNNTSVLVDTSAIIDGRIADLLSTGFMEGAFIIPRFILDELRHIADSSDPLRRNRGRRGLEILGRLRRDDHISLEVLDIGLSNGIEVDSQLVQLALSMGAGILTTDYNLNRVAEVQGVQVLNVNELANALKSIVLPGEELEVNIVQEGKEAGQGVAYLDDGTMVVVEDGRPFIDSYTYVAVTRILQTGAGRIIFAHPTRT